MHAQCSTGPTHLKSHKLALLRLTVLQNGVHFLPCLWVGLQCLDSRARLRLLQTDAGRASEHCSASTLNLIASRHGTARALKLAQLPTTSQLYVKQAHQFDT